MTNLVIEQGTTCSIEIPNITDANGAPLNPAGCSVRAQVRERAGDSSTALFEWTSTGGSPNAVLATGKVTLNIAAAVSAAWTWTTGRYDVELTDASGNTARIAEGHITVSREVTR